ncbi:hypothetical protein SB659_19230, partial [Arthrobacter sp. SIMBA_036]|uniref:hypothetical protein n=1 Tax=Arthrobacter sp. SIMBA_036 TaxID=3085778 RepID=UPI00397B8DBA
MALDQYTTRSSNKPEPPLCHMRQVFRVKTSAGSELHVVKSFSEHSIRARNAMDYFAAVRAFVC